MVEISKTWYKIIKILVKYIPYLIGIVYFIMTILSCFGIETFILSGLFYCGLVPTTCILSFSFLLNNCIWHRLPIYYVLFIQAINTIDFYWTIPISSSILLTIDVIVVGLFVLFGAYLKNRYNVKNRIG